MVHNGVPTLVYTGTQPETQCIATTSDNLRNFHKSDRNPVIAVPPPGLKLTGFRDPCLWREGDGWMMALGSGFPDVGGAVLLYSSKDLVSWSYLHPLCQGIKAETGFNWECPNFFPLGGRHVLLISNDKPEFKVLYFIGTYENQRFTPESQGVFDAGGSLYAPQTFRDKDGRRTLIGWLRETRPEAEYAKAGWSGVQSLPRVLTLRPDRTLGVEPHPNALAVRVAGSAGAGAQAAFDVQLAKSSGGAELHVGSEALPIEYAGGSLTVGNYSAPMKLDPGETPRLTVFVDHSVVEVFANGRVAMAVRVYPSLSDPVRLDAPGARVTAYRVPATVQLS